MLYQKTRPKTFKDFIGNKPAVASLAAALAREDRPHVFLFHGPSGCGKTTLARVFANELGTTEFNLIEKNAATSRGIDMVRDIEGYADTAPMGGTSRVIILDEAHQLTKDAQNGLLKLLEDMAPHSYYLLCSTEPTRIIKTIQTRCATIPVRKLKEDEMSSLLDQVCDRAEMAYPADVLLDAIIDQAEGCPRDAVVMLESTIGMDPEDAVKLIRSGKIVEAGQSGASLELCRTVASGNWKRARKAFAELLEEDSGTDSEHVRRGLLGYLKSCTMKSTDTKSAARFIDKMEELVEPTFNSNWPGLLVMVFRACDV